MLYFTPVYRVLVNDPLICPSELPCHDYRNGLYAHHIQKLTLNTLDSVSFCGDLLKLFKENLKNPALYPPKQRKG